MKDKMATEIVKRHGKDVYIVSKKDWDNFIKELKKNSDLYNLCKEKFDFNMTRIELELEEIPNLTGMN